MSVLTMVADVMAFPIIFYVENRRSDAWIPVEAVNKVISSLKRQSTDSRTSVDVFPLISI